MDYFKVMVTGNNEGIIWDTAKEIELESDHIAFQYLSREIDISEWKNLYLDLFKKWLVDDDDSIYEITNSINMKMIDALVIINSETSDFRLYYWFDVDRDKYPNYVWKKCPLAGTDLIDLPEHYNNNNRKISVNYPLVFPLGQ